MNTTETLSAILAEMRDGIHTGRADIIDCVNDRLRSYADRIEAAVKRERAITDAMLTVKDKLLPHPDPENAPPLFAAHGNAAAMREALEWAAQFVELGVDDDLGADGQNLATAAEMARAALAAPARNCDRFATADEAVAAFADHLRAWENAHGICSEYPDHPVKVPAGAFAWLFATAQEGGAE